MDSKGRLSQTNVACNSYKMEEGGRGVVTRSTGRKGEKMEGEEHIGREERGEKHPKVVVHTGQCVQVCLCTCRGVQVHRHMYM